MKEVRTGEAADIANVSEGTIRKRLVPVRVEQVRSPGRGTRYVHYYALEDAEALRDKKTLPTREHPDAEALSQLQARASHASDTRAHGEWAAKAAHSLTVRVPSSMPTCCKRHARNCVRHEGSNYEALISGLRSRAGYGSVRDTLNEKVDAAIGDRMPALDDCHMR